MPVYPIEKIRESRPDQGPDNHVPRIVDTRNNPAEHHQQTDSEDSTDKNPAFKKLDRCEKRSRCKDRVARGERVVRQVCDCTSSAHLAPLAVQSKRYFLLMVTPV